ncbi:MAG: GNAT family N-acetyltransferase [Lachnospiraceae bacterium]|nr:GNAT family N-acetyltransferase [Lachnospiraceae bacterium]
MINIDDLSVVYYKNLYKLPIVNLCRLPLQDAFIIARAIDASTSFADFEEYYNWRTQANKHLYDCFTMYGGKPKEMQPLPFVLQGSTFLDNWLMGEIKKFPLKDIPDEAISFTFGNSADIFQSGRALTIYTKSTMRAVLEEYEGTIDDYFNTITVKHKYIEIQIWDDRYCREISSLLPKNFYRHFEIQIDNMKSEDVDKAVKLWVDQFKLYGDDDEFPQYWLENTEEIAALLENQIQNETIVVARADKQILGFLGYFTFDFHNEKTALCNITSHAAKEFNKEQIYLALYMHVSKKWVGQNIFNHLWIFLSKDNKLKTFFYDLGFGSYVVDAYAKPSVVESIIENGINCPFKIWLADEDDLDKLEEIIHESLRYYEAEPLFLRREDVDIEYIKELIRNFNIYVAWDDDKIIGFIQVNSATENDTETLATMNCGLIEGIGLYIRPEYRGKNVGVYLLENAFDYCKENSLDYLHVDFETANPNANIFWRKYFKPMASSVRRTVNKDANMKS